MASGRWPAEACLAGSAHLLTLQPGKEALPEGAQCVAKCHAFQDARRRSRWQPLDRWSEWPGLLSAARWWGKRRAAGGDPVHARFDALLGESEAPIFGPDFGPDFGAAFAKTIAGCLTLGRLAASLLGPQSWRKLYRRGRFLTFLGATPSLRCATEGISPELCVWRRRCERTLADGTFANFFWHSLENRNPADDAGIEEWSSGLCVARPSRRERRRTVASVFPSTDRASRLVVWVKWRPSESAGAGLQETLAALLFEHSMCRGPPTVRVQAFPKELGPDSGPESRVAEVSDFCLRSSVSRCNFSKRVRR